MKHTRFISSLLGVYCLTWFMPFYGYGFNGNFRLTDAGTVVDQKGRSLETNQPFKRLVSLYGAHTENLFQMGADKVLIAVGPHETYPSEALKKPSVSYKDGPEKFLALKPDLILIRPMIDRGYDPLILQLEKQGITVLSLQPSTIDEMIVYFRILGRVSGNVSQAEDMIDIFNASLSYLETVTKTIPVKKKVYLEAIHQRMKTFSKDSITAFVLERAGGIHMGNDACPSRGTNIANYGKERILSHASEIDVFIGQKGKMNPVTKEMIMNEPGFQTIKAIQNGQVYLIDEEIISRPSLRLIDGIFEMGRMIYPEVFTPQVRENLDQIRRSVSKG